MLPMLANQNSTVLVNSLAPLHSFSKSYPLNLFLFWIEVLYNAME